MYIHGEFVNQRGSVVAVHIVTRGDTSAVMEIGDDASGVYFTDDPCEITSEVNDTFDVLLRKSATISLLCRNYVPDFFCTSCRDAVVNIMENGECVFAGYIEPQTYSQGYNEVYDELTLNCVDALSALQYSFYKGINTGGVTYAGVKASASTRTFAAIIGEVLDNITDGLSIAGGTVRYMHDGSKKESASATGSIFGALNISELLFLGDSEDDVWTQDTVLEELLRYLNLHIVQEGLTFYVFDWATVRGGTATWSEVGGSGTESTALTEFEISTDIVTDCDTEISIGDVYNQLALTCDIANVEDVIDSPLDSDTLFSPYDSKQLYLTEYSVDGKKKTLGAFWKMCHGTTTDHGDGRITRWYMQVKRNSYWTFPKNGDTGTDLVDYFYNGGGLQQLLPNWLGSNPGAAILSLGSVTIETAKNDNSLTSKVNMSDYFVLSVNGNGVDAADSTTYPTPDTIMANIPYAVYTGINGGNFSPSDDKTTNYIVFSGSFILNPLMPMSATYHDVNASVIYDAGLGLLGYSDGSTKPVKRVSSRDNSADGRYYTRQYFKAAKPTDEAEWDSAVDDGFIPFTGKGPEEYEYKYSSVGDSSDTISKVAVLACMLVIGNKVLVEKLPEDGGSGNGQISDFEWRTYKTRPQCSDDDEYYSQCFTLGFDPKIGDKIIGTEYDIQNNISYTLNIDAEGTAIPIRQSDGVSGDVSFQILGPVYEIWDNVTRRHKTWFRRAKWTSTSVPLLAHTSNIMVKDFECKVYSDGGSTDSGDNDVIYVSDTNEAFYNKKDDLEFKVNSALTSDECKTLGVSNTVNLSTPLLGSGEGVLKIYDNTQGVAAKAEQLYVDAYYSEYHEPRVEMTQSVRGDCASFMAHYHHPAMDKTFYVVGVSRNMIEGNAELKLKELY